MTTPGSNSPTEHLWFVITVPDSHGECVLVSLTTLRYGKDQTVPLGTTDHSFITHQSVVFYAQPVLVAATTLSRQLADGLIKYHEECTPELLKLIQDGLLASPATPKKFIAHCKTAWATTVKDLPTSA